MFLSFRFVFYCSVVSVMYVLPNEYMFHQCFLASQTLAAVYKSINAVLLLDSLVSEIEKC